MYAAGISPLCSGTTWRSLTATSFIETVIEMFSCGTSWVDETGMVSPSLMFTLSVEAW